MRRGKFRQATFAVAAMGLLFPAHGFAVGKVNPADYPIKVHVSSAKLDRDGLDQRIKVEINGRHYLMQGATSGAKIYTHAEGLLDPGDYMARLVKDEHKTAYETLQEYELLFSDGKTRTFYVIGQAE